VFGGLVRAYRQRLGLTQEELAHKARVNVRTIGKLEAGQIGNPRPATVRLLADALELPEPERARFHTAATSPEQSSVESRPVPRQLPADVAGFTGRDRQVSQLDDLLDGSARPAPVAVLTGTAGVGKTALAVHWAHRARARFVDGELYVNLRGYAPGRPLEPIEALAHFLDALGVAAERIPVDVDRAAGLYRSFLAERRILVVLDNARGAEQVRPLLPGSPGCLVLVTSRQKLTGLVAREGARQLSLDVMPAAESMSLLTRLLGADRVGAERHAATELAALCEGLPLALRIAAANLIVKPRALISAYTGQLRAGDRLTTLAVEGDEQTGVRATFELSYAALPDDLRRLFRLLAVVPGPDVTPPVAAELIEVTPAVARRTLDQLCGAHLIDEYLPGRYAWHDLLRLYAGELVTADDEAVRDGATHRVNDWYLSRCDAAAQLLYPQLLRFDRLDHPPSTFDDSAQALAWLDAERANLVALAVHTAGQGPRTVACRLADALRGYFWLRSDTVDWFTVARAGLAAADATGDLRARTSAHLSLGMANSSVSRHRDAIHHYTEALTLARSAGWTVAEANALGQIGMAHTTLEQLPEAMAHLRRALALNRRLDATGRQAINLDGLGRVHFMAGRLRRAETHIARAFALQREGSLGSLGIAVTMLGLVRHQLGQLDRALEHLTEGARLTRRLNSIANES
jgi:transcriptional regulator with XRE-family HTH domain/tetratricopeptide (TPR) repeat protein